MIQTTIRFAAVLMILANASICQARGEFSGRIRSEDQPGMSEAAIRKELIDVAMTGHYFDGQPWEETYFADQRITYKDTNNNWIGEWSFRGSGFCTFYNKGRNGGCWQIIKTGTNCYYFYGMPTDGNPPAATPGRLRKWTARGWRKDAASSCDVEVGA